MNGETKRCEREEEMIYTRAINKAAGRRGNIGRREQIRHGRRVERRDSKRGINAIPRMRSTKVERFRQTITYTVLTYTVLTYTVLSLWRRNERASYGSANEPPGYGWL